MPPKQRRSPTIIQRRKLQWFIDQYKGMFVKRKEWFERRQMLAPVLFPQYSQPAFRYPGLFNPPLQALKGAPLAKGDVQPYRPLIPWEPPKS